MKLKVTISIFVFLLVIFSIGFSCIAFKYVYYEQSQVILPNIDIDGSLDIADLKLQLGGFDSILTMWALRDQFITPVQAERISTLYFRYIDKLDNEFGIWHLSWAISDFYRLGDSEVKEKLQSAYDDAKLRPEQLKQFQKIANLHINGSKIYMGFIHDLGKSFAHTHLIVPGNKDFLQSFHDFVKQNKKNKKLMQLVEEFNQEKS